MAGRYKKRGCSFQSLEAADEWRKLHCKTLPKTTKPVSPIPVTLTPDDADEISMVSEDGTLHRPSVEANLKTLQQLVAQSKTAVAHAMESGENEIGRRWVITLTNVVSRAAIVAQQLQDLLERDKVTMRHDDVREVYINSLAEMRRLIEAGCESLPPMLNPQDHAHAHEVLGDWFRNQFLKSMYAHSEGRDIGPEEWEQIAEQGRKNRL